MKKKQFLGTMLTASMVLTTALTGCGGTEQTTTAAATEATTAAATAAATEATTAAATEAEAPVEGAADTYDECTLTFDWWGGDARHEATLAAVDAFMAKYPGIKVEVNYGAWSDWETAKAAEYVSGKNADVQQTNFDWIRKYDSDGNTYLDLGTVSDVLDLTQYDQTTIGKTVDAKGGTAGVPVSLTGRLFYWNKATFEKAGLSTPTTLAELMAAGPIFQEKLGDNYYPLAIGEYDRMILMAFYLQAQTGTPIIDENGNLTVTKDQLAQGLTWIKSLEEAHVIPTEEYLIGEGADSMDKSARFIAGEYAGIFEWDSSSSKYIKALGDNGSDLVVGNELMDMGPNGSGCFTKVTLMFSISAKTEHPKEAAMLLNYLLNDPEGTAIMGTQRGIPESAAAYATLESSGSIDEIAAAAHASVMDANPMYWNPLFDDSSLKGSTSTYTDVFDGLSYGDYSVDEAADVLYNAMVAVAPAK